MSESYSLCLRECERNFDGPEVVWGFLTSLVGFDQAILRCLWEYRIVRIGQIHASHRVYVVKSLRANINLGFFLSANAIEGGGK